MFVLIGHQSYPYFIYVFLFYFKVSTHFTIMLHLIVNGQGQCLRHNHHCWRNKTLPVAYVTDCCSIYTISNVYNMLYTQSKKRGPRNKAADTGRMQFSITWVMEVRAKGFREKMGFREGFEGREEEL